MNQLPEASDLNLSVLPPINVNELTCSDSNMEPHQNDKDFLSNSFDKKSVQNESLFRLFTTEFYYSHDTDENRPYGEVSRQPHQHCLINLGVEIAD